LAKTRCIDGRYWEKISPHLAEKFRGKNLTELEERSATLGTPPSECADTDPRKLVFESLRYLRNNADRMRYDDYRRQGLPIMTSAVESVIKMINKRLGAARSSGRRRAPKQFSNPALTT
jgi:hypothetical protein